MKTQSKRAPETLSPGGLYEAWAELQRYEPGVRAHDAAEALEVSEADLVASTCGDTATRLDGPWDEMLAGLHRMGQLTTVTRNECAVHETVGRYGRVHVMGGNLFVRGVGIDLRLLTGKWHVGFAVRRSTEAGPRYSLQFFDRHGIAVHKIYLGEEVRQDAYESLVNRHAHDDQSTAQNTDAPESRTADHPDGQVNVDTLRTRWASLEDTHDFTPMLAEQGVSRLQALRLAGNDFARRLPPPALRRLMHGAHAAGIPVMVFVPNSGAVQISTGPVGRVRLTNGWTNVTSPTFTLHVRDDRIDSVWVVQKPTVDGVVTSLELYTADGENVVLFYGERNPGHAESLVWRDLVAWVERGKR